MAKTAEKKEEQPKTVIHHADLLTAEQKRQTGVQYTYDWGKVTDPKHLKTRNQQLVDAQNGGVPTEGGPVDSAEAIESEANAPKI